MTEEQKLRLEIIKIIYRHNATPDINVLDAKVVEEYVKGKTAHCADVKDTAVKTISKGSK